MAANDVRKTEMKTQAGKLRRGDNEHKLALG
ncbi:hypothetical protein HMPREF9138_02016 [Prevotella histicola F0411]|uniref:Uncharacterized protein n=1 Tax=Prevotella histicola F0411 TaxID=857291 RepID=G6AIT9_9BACT|nr:hypothetical protein HMPREF9138_02016 [Prevotella histicola F0411]